MAFPSWLPLGLGLMDYYQSGERTLIQVHTVDGEITPYPAEIFFRDYDDFSIMDEAACALARGVVLDVGAGTGCISLYLQDLGLEVTAIDVAPQLVEIMESQGVLDPHCADFFSWKAPELYDTILLMMNGIGFVGDLKGLDKFLKKAKRMLAPGGQILFDSSDLKFADIGGADLRAKKGGYYGEVWYQLEYKGMKGKPYSWLYLDPETLRTHAERHGYRTEIVEEATEGYYLARLQIAEEKA